MLVSQPQKAHNVVDGQPTIAQVVAAKTKQPRDAELRGQGQQL
eukprot:CAMPEP_0115144940 /NCGR_PEP_ID=MMETSP0227-20121206/61816_1 /TAXON_ID=89957 /ORGANISM="Polarella glacialis, Strain CCMP 1383" /LENGTH=42 /DNA_ID= /DNA_START= /DNA_END= /DNA_ORIENTATION=